MLLLAGQPRFATDKWDNISNYVVTLCSTSYRSGVFILVCFSQHKDNKSHPIDGGIKGKDHFNSRTEQLTNKKHY